ncbi:MAG TPA: lipid kinase [Coleofasciculaceae cyanobacterium]|jgi:YegS/Rv2252/BmrU family lipid kinase
MTQRALLLVNRHSRRGHKTLSQVVSQLEALGFELFEESTQKPQHLSDTIRSYRDRVDLVIIGGGDGTLNAAVEGLVDTQLPLGILPLGTANDLARTLEIPQSIPQACEIIATGNTRRIDLGKVNHKLFFNVASLGLSVQITRQLDKEVKRRWGVLAYAVTALKVIWKARGFTAEIRLGEESIRVKTVQIAVGNGRYYGGGMAVADDAAINDQRLDLYSLEYDHWWQILMLLPAMWRGKQANWSGVRTLEGKEFEIYTRRPHPINADGEIVTYTPAKFRLIPHAVEVFVPQLPRITG